MILNYETKIKNVPFEVRYCNIGYTSEKHLEFTSDVVFFVHNQRVIGQTVRGIVQSMKASQSD